MKVNRKKLICAGIALLSGASAGASSESTYREAPNVIDFQIYKTQEEKTFGDRKVRLINLNSNINSWYLLQVSSGANWVTYNLENNKPESATLGLAEKGIVIRDHGRNLECDLLDSRSQQFIGRAAEGRKGYVEMCEGQISLRLEGRGSVPMISAMASLLKSSRLGERAVDLAKAVTQDRDKISGNITHENGELSTSQQKPFRARITEEATKLAAKVSQLQIQLANGFHSKPLAIGEWYPTANHPGVFFSIINAGSVAREILISDRDRVKDLDDSESQAESFMVAMDLSQYEVRWGHGTHLPGVGWSARAQDRVRVELAGPDGFGSLAPLQSTGTVNPALLDRLVATMCGGFQRRDSAFKFGDLSKNRRGNHYGFIENGVMMSQLHPGLITAISYKDGSFDLKAWTDADNARLPEIRFARQNGVPLIENGRPGVFVSKWGEGNWSGSESGNLRSSRAAACISVQNEKRFLIYGYFSSATPNAMARIFQSYGCRDAIHLDMNSPGQGYFGLISNARGQVIVENPIAAMANSNTKMNLPQGGGQVQAPRFVGNADGMDFFYFLRRK